MPCLETCLDTDFSKPLITSHPHESVALSLTGPATPHPLPGDHSVVEPPDPFPNSEVKRNRADGSVAQAMQE